MRDIHIMKEREKESEREREREIGLQRKTGKQTVRAREGKTE